MEQVIDILKKELTKQELISSTISKAKDIVGVPYPKELIDKGYENNILIEKIEDAIRLLKMKRAIDIIDTLIDEGKISEN